MTRSTATVGIRELRDHASEMIRRVRAGEALVVTDRNEPVARIVPFGAPADDDTVARLVAEGKVAWSGGKPQGASRRARVRGPSAAEAVIEDRR